MPDDKFAFDVPEELTSARGGSSSVTEGRSSVKIKLTSAGKISVEVKIYEGITPEERENIYQVAVEIIDRLKMRYHKT